MYLRRSAKGRLLLEEIDLPCESFDFLDDDTEGLFLNLSLFPMFVVVVVVVVEFLRHSVFSVRSVECSCDTVS